MKIIASTKVFEEKGKVFIRALAASGKYLTPDQIPVLTKYSVNQPLIYRHIHPSSPAQGQILGTVVEAKQVEFEGLPAVEIIGEMMQITDYQQKAVEYIRLKQDTDEPVGVSIGLQSFGVEGENPVTSRPFEYSFTSIPVCDECITYEVNTSMKEKDIADAKQAELEAVIKGNVQKIAELEATLNGKVDENKSLKSKIGVLEKAPPADEIAVKDAINEAAKAIKSQYEDEMKAVKADLKATNQKLEAAEKKPHIDKLIALEKDDDLVEWYNGKSVEFLTARYEKKKKERKSSIVTQTLNEAGEEVEDDHTAELAKIKASIEDRYFNKK